MCHMYMYKNFSAHLITGDNLWFSSNPAACTSADVWHGHPSHISWGQKHPCPQNSPSQLITTHVHSSPPHWLPSHLPYFFICLIPFSHPLENPKAYASPLSTPKIPAAAAATSIESRLVCLILVAIYWSPTVATPSVVQHRVRRISDYCPFLRSLSFSPSSFGLIPF
jgi:hypothetical protein